jgi:hypothetical protein
VSRDNSTSSPNPNAIPRRRGPAAVLSEQELASPEACEKLKNNLESCSARNIKVYVGTWRPIENFGKAMGKALQSGFVAASASATIVREEGSELLCSHDAPRDLLDWLKARNAKTWTAPVVIEAEFPLLKQRSSLEQRPRDWHKKLREIRNNMDEDLGLLEFGNAWESVRRLAQAIEPIGQETQIENLWRMHPEAADKIGLPKLLGSNFIQNKTELTRLTKREQKMWDVIQGGARGPQYCHELDSAGIAPLRSGNWRDCPRKYESAYLEGKPWRHRIQDEKCKVRRKAELAGLASE